MRGKYKHSSGLKYFLKITQKAVDMSTKRVKLLSNEQRQPKRTEGEYRAQAEWLGMDLPIYPP